MRRKDQMQVSHVDKDMVEQSNTVPIFNLEGGLKPCLGLDLIKSRSSHYLKSFLDKNISEETILIFFT